MRIVFPIIFKDKISSVHKLSHYQQDNYNKLIGGILNENFKLGIINENEYSDILQTPIDSTRSEDIRDYIINNISNNSTIINNGIFANDEISIFIDASEIKREPVIFSLLFAISSFLNKEFVKLRFMLLINDLQTTKELTLTFFSDYIDKNQLLIFDLTGKTANEKYRDVFDENIKDLISKLYIPLHLLIEKKIVTKLGHFKREDKGTNHLCFRTYLDGRFCIKEIVSYITAYLEEKHIKKPIVIYNSKHSPWLYDVIYSLSSKKIIGDFFDVFLLADEEIKHKFESLKKTDAKALFLTDLINSGSTFVDNYNQIKKHTFFSIYSSNILFLSILNNREKYSNKSKQHRIRKVKITNTTTISVDYIVDVIVNEDYKNNCILCKLGVPLSNFDQNYKTGLTSFEFWEMCHRATYIYEEVHPKHRKAVKPYPYMSHLIEENSQYIAYKFELALRSKNIETNDIVLILPDESKKGKEFIHTPSGKLAQCLNFIFDIEYIVIPRSVIDKFTGKPFQLKGDTIWEKQIIQTSKKVIVVDESHIGGSTFETLFEILSSLHKEPLVFFSLIDFNPKKSTKYRTKKGIDTLNLYEYQY